MYKKAKRMRKNLRTKFRLITMRNFLLSKNSDFTKSSLVIGVRQLEQVIAPNIIDMIILTLRSQFIKKNFVNKLAKNRQTFNSRTLKRKLM